MSKSIGNVVDPNEVIDKYGIDAFRYFFLRHIDTFADSDFTWEKFENAYNNELANDLGNLVQRLATMASKNGIRVKNETNVSFVPEYQELMDKFEFAKAFDFVWEKIQAINKKIDETKPWELAKNGEKEKLEETYDFLNKVFIMNLLCELLTMRKGASHSVFFYYNPLI